jgi:hypothetical protein
VNCGCGGPGRSLGWPLVVRNVALSVIATLVFLSDSVGLSTAEAVTAIASSLTLWTGFLLVEQLLANASQARSSRLERIT